ncbi:MAG TPA: heavy metal translocating P-type ATPase [Candidatus Saccharimonadales bacterium]
MRRLSRFLREYKLFSLAVVGLVAGLVLQFAGQQTAAHWVLGVVSVIELLPLLWGMWQDVRSGTYGVDILAATAILTSVILGQYWAAIVIVLMLTGGESLEDYAHHRAQAELDALLEHAPQMAHVIRKGKTVDVRVDDLKIGEKIVVKPGEVVPVDAVITEGEASFNESSLTGESLPQAKQIGDTLLSGSINEDGVVTAKVTATAENSQYQQIVRLVRSAAASQAPFVRLADRYSLPFTVTAYAIATAAWVVSGQAIRFLEVIVVATPCPLILAAPIALISGMARASKYGIIVKSGSAMERLAEARVIAFDKTGTLTTGVLEVNEVKTYGDIPEKDLLRLTASLEQNSNHVVARALVAEAKSQSIKLDKAKYVQEVSGRGLRAVIRGQQILLGRLSLLEEENVELPKTFKRSDVNQTAVYVAIDGKLSGIITLTDALRPEAKDTLERLQQLGIHETLMVTGDNQATAQAIAKSLGIDHVHAEMLPADKLRIIEETEHPLAFVGDGVNDAPVLSGADIGIALGAKGSTAASESADMVIMLDDLGRVASAYEIAKRTFSIARQSILIGIGLSVVLMLVFATGAFSPLTGAIVQEGVDIFVIFNALRAHTIAIRD